MLPLAAGGRRAPGGNAVTDHELVASVDTLSVIRGELGRSPCCCGGAKMLDDSPSMPYN
jgi:hypothetical protein